MALKRNYERLNNCLSHPIPLTQKFNRLESFVLSLTGSRAKRGLLRFGTLLIFQGTDANLRLMAQ